MRTWQTYILTGVLLAPAFCPAEATPGSQLTVPEYRIELDRLRADAQKLVVSGEVPTSLEHLPASWKVHTEQGDFEISTEGVRGDVRRYRSDKGSANASAIRTRIGSL